MDTSHRTHTFVRLFLILLLTTAFALLLSTAEASAKLKIATGVVKAADGTRVTVTLTSKTSLSAKKKPRGVKVKAAGKTIKLSRVRAATASAGYTSSWQSAAFSGADAAALEALGGKSVKVTVSARSGKTVRSSKVTVQTVGGSPGTPGSVPLFTAPGRDMSGNEAFNYLSKYFLNSAFSDCAAGPWPHCAVEERYVHCPNGYWGYQRTSGTGADIDSSSTFTVTGANVYADGSWAVSYSTTTGANYFWQVSTTGIANGTYYFGSSADPIGPMVWSQPAISWNYLSGVC
ncbi:MAG: hypothetical protein HY827_09390 [Actinobacteria bacterium]|nr:hypothetical protein [Actinomycetota bacterium]